MRVGSVVIAVVVLCAATARADPFDRRMRSFGVEFPGSWRERYASGGDRRRRAAYVLEKTGSGRTLARLAEEGDIEVKRAWLWVMQFAYEPSHEETFRKLAADYRLHDEAFDVAIVAGPESAGAQRVWRRALAHCDFAQFPAGAVARLDSDLMLTREALRRAIASQDKAVRSAALKQITAAAAYDTEVVEAALALARGEAYGTRYWAAEYVAKCGLDDPRAFDALLYAVTRGAGEGAVEALLRFDSRTAEIEAALLPAISASSNLTNPVDRVRVAHLLYRLGAVSDRVVVLLEWAAWGKWTWDGVPTEPSLSMLKNSAKCQEIALNHAHWILPQLGLVSDSYGDAFATRLDQKRCPAAVLGALPRELLARDDVRVAVRRHLPSEDRAVALAARLALWRGGVDRAELIAWARSHPADRMDFLRSAEPVRQDAQDELDRALVEMLLDPPAPDPLSRFTPFAAEIRLKVEPLLGDPRRAFEAARCLARLGFRSPNIETWLKSRLVDGRPAYAEAAVEACSAAGIDLVEAYTALLPDWRACLWLGLAGQDAEESAPNLMSLVTGPECGPEALWALGEIRAPLDEETRDKVVAILTSELQPR